VSEQTEDSIQAVALKPVDRIPLLYRSNFWFAKYSKIPIRPFFYEYDIVSEVTKKIAGNCTSRLKIIADIPRGNASIGSRVVIYSAPSKLWATMSACAAMFRRRC
jgi:hypothetical protein